MPKNVVGAPKAARRPGGQAEVGGWATRSEAGTDRVTTVHGTQMEAVMAAAQRSGLPKEKSGRIGGRVSPALVEQAKARTGIETDTDLIEFALANIALDDKFPKAFKAARGKVDRISSSGSKLAGFNIAAAVHWARFDPRRTLARRPDEALPFATNDELVGQPLLLDTCVYIDQMQGHAPDLVERLVEARQVNHSTVAIQELMHTVGVLDPADRRTRSVVQAVRAQIEAMPDHRVFAPDVDVLGRAALPAGVLSRLQGYGRGDRSRLCRIASCSYRRRDLASLC